MGDEYSKEEITFRRERICRAKMANFWDVREESLLQLKRDLNQ